MIIFHAHRGEAKLSKIIRWMSPKYNHISIEVDDVVFEAHINCGVRKTYSDDWDGSTVVESIRIKVSDYHLGRVWEFLNKQVGKKYDTLGIFAFLWWFFKPRKDRWYCSELAQVALYKALGIRSTDDDYNQKVSPYTFWRNLQLVKKSQLINR